MSGLKYLKTKKYINWVIVATILVVSISYSIKG